MLVEEEGKVDPPHRRSIQEEKHRKGWKKIEKEKVGPPPNINTRSLNAYGRGKSRPPHRRSIYARRGKGQKSIEKNRKGQKRMEKGRIVKSCPTPPKEHRRGKAQKRIEKDGKGHNSQKLPHHTEGGSSLSQKSRATRLSVSFTSTRLTDQICLNITLSLQN